MKRSPYTSRTTHHASRYGFTLVEMAVVLSIIGLIIGGIVMGASLQRGQQVRQVLADAQNYRRAFQLFQKQYEYLPGDFATAVQLWGRADGSATLTSNCAAPSTDTASGGKGTCNGDGDGLIESGNYESFRVWQHLTNANMASGYYTGIYVTGGTTYAVPGTNSPVNPIKNTTFYVDSYGVLASDTNRYDGDYDNALIYGAVTTNSYPSTAILSGKEAADIDTKVDDGYPGFGDIVSWKPAWHASCASSATASSAAYTKSNTGEVCGLFFLNTFAEAKQ